MNKPFTRFLVRWFVCGLGLWIAARLLGGDRVSYNSSLGVIIISGLVLALINIVIKPIVVILSLPAVLFSLGLFMIVINGLMVILASKLYPRLQVTNFGAAMLAGMVIGLVNYLVTTILEET
ncbi:MAG TPA: phage holin family protein [Candidatus Saccharimonadales bacterium]|nr:phage holin family protein [Candidatus Saccharimonadales bacterium]